MNYQKYALKARNKISLYGGDLRIIRNKDEVYNAETNEYESEKEEINGKGILSHYSADFINGTTVKNGDVKIMCIFNNGIPKVADIIEMGNKNYNIISIEEFNPDGKTIIYYTIQGR